MTIPKAKRLEQLRHILKDTAEICETARAEPDLLALSFQSITYPERHVWVYTREEDKIDIDLEDWYVEGEWDHTVSRKVAYSPDEAADIICEWLA